jgi:hypothetical protein
MNIILFVSINAAKIRHINIIIIDYIIIYLQFEILLFKSGRATKLKHIIVIIIIA